MPVQQNTTMKGALQTEFANPSEVLTVEDNLVKPTIEKPTDIIIKVNSVSINPIDYKLLNGDIGKLMRVKMPITPGFDVAGIVSEVGANVTLFKVGDRVYGDIGSGMTSMAEYCKTTEKALHHTPANLTDEEAASIPLVGLTAYQCLVNHGNFKKGQKVFVVGGTSSVGAFVIQFAKALGAGHVACSASQEDIVKGKFGADEMINYRNQDWGEALEGQNYDLVVDCIGGLEEWQRANKILNKSGTFVTVAGDTTAALTIPVVFGGLSKSVYRKTVSLFGMGPNYSTMLTNSNTGQTDLKIISELISEQKVVPFIDASSPYEFTEQSIRSAFTLLQSHRAKGKLVINIASP